MKRRQGFTLVELLMVIAILGLLATLAITRMGNLRRSSAQRLSLTNQAALARAVEAYLTVHEGRLNRLDSLMYYGTGRGSGLGFDFSATNTTRLTGHYLYKGPTLPAVLRAEEEDRNAGLSPSLLALLVPYSLSAQEAEAFRLLGGLRYVMCHAGDATRSPRAALGTRVSDGDGSVLSDDASLGWQPMASSCVAVSVTNGFWVAAITPATQAGREVYRDCGQELFATQERESEYDEQACIAEAKATGGILFAFGLGDWCSAIGKGQAGLESAPLSAYLPARFYRRYLLLFRLHPDHPTEPEFAGVLDPLGRTLRGAREAVDEL